MWFPDKAASWCFFKIIATLSYLKKPKIAKFWALFHQPLLMNRNLNRPQKLSFPINRLNGSMRK
jgi:hypothetical protein